MAERKKRKKRPSDLSQRAKLIVDIAAGEAPEEAQKKSPAKAKSEARKNRLTKAR